MKNSLRRHQLLYIGVTKQINNFSFEPVLGNNHAVWGSENSYDVTFAYKRKLNLKKFADGIKARIN